MSMPDDDQHMLKLQRVRSTDVGQLVVMASNQFGSDLCTLQMALAGRLVSDRVPNNDIWLMLISFCSCHSATKV